MSFKFLLIQTCKVKRRGLGDDGWSQPAGVFTDLAVGVPCRLAAHEGREIRVGSEAIISHHTLFLEPRDVTERDQVELASQIYNVLMVRDPASHGHHLELDLELVRN